MAWKLSIKCNYFVQNNITCKMNTCNGGKCQNISVISRTAYRLLKRQDSGSIALGFLASLTLGLFPQSRSPQWLPLGAFYTGCRDGIWTKLSVRSTAPFILVLPGALTFDFIFGSTGRYSMCMTLADGDAEGKAGFYSFLHTIAVCFSTSHIHVCKTLAAWGLILTSIRIQVFCWLPNSTNPPCLSSF